MVAATRSNVLPDGAVEGRGTGTHLSSDEVSKEIQDFLQGVGRLSWLAECRAFFTVWIFITRLPAPTSWIDLHPGFLMRGMAYFPAVGALIGAFVGVCFDIASDCLGLPPMVAASIATASGLWISGAFHEDGLADTADGFGGGWTREEILTIMTDSRVGTYGSSALALYMITKVALLAEHSASIWQWYSCKGAAPAVLVAQCAARLTAPLLIKTRKYVEEMGPKSNFYVFMVEAKHLVSWQRVLCAVGVVFGLARTLYGTTRALVVLASVALMASASGYYGDLMLGGVMGDYLGATICVTELVVLAVVWLASEYHSSIERLCQQLLSPTTAYQYDLFVKSPASAAAFARFVFAVVSITVWKQCVGFRERKPSAADKSENQTRGKDSAELIAAKAVCSDSSSTFEERYTVVGQYIDTLAKPVGSLGLLEDWAARLAALQRSMHPSVAPAVCLIFAADHGVAKSSEEGGELCSLYPQSVTRNILAGLERGIAGASVLARQNGALLSVYDVGVVGEPFKGKVVSSSVNKLVGGTRNFCKGAAMSSEELERCIRIGRETAAHTIVKSQAKVVILGEVGIGNTTAASAIIAQLCGVKIETVCGGGATMTRSIDKKAVAKKVAIVDLALRLHREHIESASDVLARLGGAEIAAMVGALLEASEREVAVLLDGFIVSAAALAAATLSPNCCRIMLFASKSAEPGHSVAIERVQRIAADHGVLAPHPPALGMSLRLGEGSAALLALPILKAATTVLAEMGTIQNILEAK